jgi:hydrogenase maturation protease
VKTIVIGLGNPILGDDGVGWQIAQQLQQRSDFPSGIEVDYLSLGGLSLMERLIGYERAILIDSIVSDNHPIGTLSCFSLDQLPNRTIGHTYSAHDTTLQNALRIGQDLGAQLPKEIVVVAVEARKVYDFSEQLSPDVAAAIPNAVQMIIDLLGG